MPSNELENAREQFLHRLTQEGLSLIGQQPLVAYWQAVEDEAKATSDLANLDRWERLAQETTNRNAPISNHFRMLFRTRALAKLGDEKRAREHLDRLVKEVGNDRDTMLRICEYLEKTRDVPSLTYLLHRIVETDPLLEPYAFRKLLVYERDTAALEQICFWYEKLHDVGKNLQQFRAHKAYYDLLAGINLGESTLVARSLHSSNPEDLEARILVALTHLRSDDPDPYEALRILETTPIPNWDKGRLGWKIIYSYILQKTSHPDKAEKLLETIATAKLSRAEREGIEKL